MSAPGHLVSLEIDNVKRLKAVRISPDGNVVTIAGENGQGKSSVLDSIEYLFGGRETHPAEVIRRGAETARIVGRIDGLVVERRFTAKGTVLEVRSEDGAKYPSPQTVVDKLYGALTFDPLRFLQLEPKKQADQLRQLGGLDFAELDARRQAVFEKRTEVNAQGKSMRARFDAMPVPPADVPEKPVSLDQLLAEQDKLQEEKRANDGVRQLQRELEQKAAEARTKATRSTELVDNLRAQLRLAEADLQKDVLQAEHLGKERDAFAPRVQALVDPDLAELYRRMKQLEATNDLVRAAAARRRLDAELAALRESKTKLENELNAIDATKAEALKKAKLPVEGLGFDENGLTFNGLPLEQASQAERIRVAVAMGIAANPKMKVILVRDASLLDTKSLQLMVEMAAAAGFQVWLERVSSDRTVGVVIEDGEVLAAAPALQLVKP